MKVFVVALFISLMMVSAVVWAQEPEKIVRIEITGNESIDRGVIANTLKTKENQPYNPEKLREDMKSIYKTGFFSDVQIDVQDTDQGKVVTFVVIERPPIKTIYISGNKKIKTEDIREKLKVRPNTVMNIEKIKESMDEVRKLYASKGFYNARVAYEIVPEEGYDIGVRFTIDEPQKAFVRKISFTGNRAFKAGKLMDRMSVREKGWFSWFTGSGILDEEALEEDRKRIEAFYADNGYVKAKVGVPDITVSKDAKTIAITLPIEEGSIYKVGTIDFAGDIIFSREELLKDMKSKPGAVFRSSVYQADVITLTDLYQDKGYAFCDIAPLSVTDDNTRTIDLTFNVIKGQEIYVNRINILGNTRTRDKVIRRELRIAEGDRYSATNLKRSKERLTNTTYFKEIDMKLIKTDEPDKINLDVAVEERPTGSLNLGVGYSTSEKAVLSGSVSQQNFLGTGRKVYLNASLGSVTNQFSFTFVEPYIFDLNLSAGLSAFHYKREMDSYDYKLSGGSFSLTRPLTDYVKSSIRYRYETATVENISEDASNYIKEQEGTSTTSSVTLSLSKNTIDNVMNPSKGINTEVSFELAGGPFGADNDFYRTIGSYGRYIPAGFWDTTFFIRGTAGTIQGYSGKKVPIYEKFYVGGLSTVRGFKYGEAGPLDENGDPIGSKNQLFFNLEWIFPVFKPAGIKGVLFFDAGHGFDESKGFLMNGARTAAGAGIRWFSPFGPIRLELGFNLSPKKDEKSNYFDFAIGSQF
ncbi:outer membrane protein assembly factor BamA [Syntrophorhabdus aromaticivorans]|uniref:outer membrane protein assembly factor BamA n=1 Tax=Syntrophorhabdus aromaticivorans TaxID=328301 RepID=UPI0009FCC2A9|nr:outer membrane protein assembly factor BamA [Syntrophorhabdus aromaticivorans]